MKISIMHGCLVQIENSFTRVTVQHHQACQVMESSVCKEQLLWILFLAYPRSSNTIKLARPGSLVRCASACYSDSCEFNPPVRKNIYFMEIGHERTFVLMVGRLAKGEI